MLTLVVHADNASNPTVIVIAPEKGVRGLIEEFTI
jgi:hypothetical protein